jgi:hypothetical protein
VRMDESGKLKPDDDDDENPSIGENLQHKIQAAFELRNTVEPPGRSTKPKTASSNTNKINNAKNPSNTGQKTRSNNLEDLSPAKTLKTMKGKGSNSDDDLMTKFFENMEESG